MCDDDSRAQVASITRFPVQINYIMRKTDGIFQSQVKKQFSCNIFETICDDKDLFVT